MRKINWKRVFLFFIINTIVFMFLNPILNWIYGHFANNDYVFTLAGDLKNALGFACFFTVLEEIHYIRKSTKENKDDKTE